MVPQKLGRFGDTTKDVETRKDVRICGDHDCIRVRYTCLVTVCLTYLLDMNREFTMTESSEQKS